MTDDSDTARNHPLIAEFIAKVDAQTDDGIPSLKTIQDPGFLPFWPYLIVHTFQQPSNDFLTTYYGTHVATMYGQDCTGKMMTEMGFGDAVELIRGKNKEVLDTRQRAFSSYGIFWQERDHLTIHQVKMPMRRTDSAINDVLVCMKIE